MKRNGMRMLAAMGLCLGLATSAQASGYLSPPQCQQYNEASYQLTEAVNDWYDLSYTYDSEGRLMQVKNTNQSSTTGYTQTYLYDENGRVTQVRTAYDGVDDPVLPVPATTTVWDYRYDANGRLQSIVLDGEYEINTFTYDNQGRLTGELDDLGNPVSYTYDNQGRIDTSNTDGFVLHYRYDGQGRLIERYNAEEDYWERYTYDSNGNHIRTETSDGTVETFRYVPKSTGENQGFADVPAGAYYASAVAWAAEKGISNGTGGGNFQPNAPVTRGQLVTFLWRAYGSPKVTGEMPFADVGAQDYCHDAVLWAVANHITSGTTDTTFSPDAPVTRGQAVTFQWRAAGAPAVSGGSFGDVASDAYFAQAVAWAACNGITNGTDGGFQPDTTVSRAQAVTFLFRELS